MKRFKKEKQQVLIFDYDNFIDKSSQQRYVELMNEIKNKLDNIEDEINIAGSSKEEKKYNLLMHYKYLLESFEFDREFTKYRFQTTAAFITAIVMIISAWITAVLGLKFEEWNAVITYMFGIFLMLVAIFLFLNIYLQDIRDGKKDIKRESQQYLYYNFYYTELKKYIKEDN